jgi:hypothetical protein
MDFVYSKLVTMLTQQLQKKKQRFQLFRFSPLSAIIKAMGMGANKFATISRLVLGLTTGYPPFYAILFFCVCVHKVPGACR